MCEMCGCGNVPADKTKARRNLTDEKDIQVAKEKQASESSGYDARESKSEPKAGKEMPMKYTPSIKRLLSTLVIGLTFLSAVQAQTQESKGKGLGSGSEDALVCVYKITGKGDMAGMRCEGCTARVRTALEGVDGVVSVHNVDLATQTATVIVSKKSQALDNIPRAVEEVNFVATLIPEKVEAGEVTSDKPKGGLLNRIRSLLRI